MWDGGMREQTRADTQHGDNKQAVCTRRWPTEEQRIGEGTLVRAGGAE